MTEHNYTFETMAELEALLDLPHVIPSNAHMSYSENANWFCADRRVRGIEDTKKHLHAQTFDAGVNRVLALAGKIVAPTPVSRRRRQVWADQGDDLDMRKVWEGNLETAWRSSRRQMSVGPSRVLIALNIGASAYVKSEELASRGAAALALADRLLEAGYIVQIIGYDYSELCDDANTPYRAVVSLLKAGDMLDLHKLASLVASGLLFRAVILEHKCRVATTRIDSGVSWQREKTNEIDASGFDYLAQLSKSDGVKDAQSAEAWVKKHIVALGGGSAE